MLGARREDFPFADGLDLPRVPRDTGAVSVNQFAAEMPGFDHAICRAERGKRGEYGKRPAKKGLAGQGRGKNGQSRGTDAEIAGQLSQSRMALEQGLRGGNGALHFFLFGLSRYGCGDGTGRTGG